MPQTTNVIDGGILLMYVNGIAVAKSTNHSFSYSVATRDITNKDSAGAKRVLGGLKSWTASTDCLYAFDGTGNFKALFALAKARAAVTLLMARSANSGDYYYEGSAILTSLELTAPNGGENSTFTASFEGDDDVTEATLT